MPLLFHQYVTIHNARLQILSSTLFVLVGSVCVFQFFYFKGHGRGFPIDGRANAWAAGNTDAAVLNSFAASKAGSTFCSSPSMYDYQSGVKKFQNHSCINVCSKQQQTSGNCLTPGETAIQETDDSILIVTHMQQTTYSTHHDDVRNYFVPSAEALLVQLSYGFRAPNMRWWHYSPKPGEHTMHSSNMKTSTVLLDHFDRKVSVIPGGEPISMTIEQLLSLSGQGSLDTQKWGLGRNRISGRLNPLLRMSGIDLTIDLECGDFKEVTVGGVPDGQACYLRVKPTVGTWAQAAFPSLFGKNQHRTYRGVRVRTSMRGKQFSLDINSIFINIASGAVLLCLPRAIVFLIAAFCCGHMSTIYRHLIYKRFDISEEVSAMAMRLLAHEAAFNDLEQSDDKCAPLGYITRDTIIGSFNHILEKRCHIDSTRLAHMIDFCLATLAKDFAPPRVGTDWQYWCTQILDGVNTALSDLKESFGCGSNTTYRPASTIDVDSFTAACSSADPISFNSVITLFDKDRKLSFMEKFFMPSQLEAILLASKPGGEEEAQVDRAAFNLSRSGSAKIQLPRVKEDINTVHEGLQGEINDLECKLTTQSCTTDTMAEIIQEMSRELAELKENVQGVGHIGQQKAKSTEQNAPQIEANVMPDWVSTKLRELESQQEEMRNWLVIAIAKLEDKLDFTQKSQQVVAHRENPRAPVAHEGNSKALVASVSSARWERLDSDVARLKAQLQREADETLTEAHTQK